MKDYLNYKEASHYLNIGVPTLYALVCQKRIPHIKIGNRFVRFKTKALTDWMDRHEVKANARPKND